MEQNVSLFKSERWKRKPFPIILIRPTGPMAFAEENYNLIPELLNQEGIGFLSSVQTRDS